MTDTHSMRHGRPRLQRMMLDAMAAPAGLWTEPDVLDALAARDIGQVFRLVQRATRASQTKIGIATGLSQAQVSEIMSGRRQVSTIDVLARIILGLGIPDPARTVLLLGDRSYSPNTAEATSRATDRVPQLNTDTEKFDVQFDVDVDPTLSKRFSDVVAVYSTRSQFTSDLPTHALFDKARKVRVAGLSLNLLCQQYADNHLFHLIEGGLQLQCLFLEPDGASVRARELEEGCPSGYLSSLTRLNIDNLLHRIRDRLDDEKRNNLKVATYDQLIRFNITLIDDKLCVAQPYLPNSRGVDSPTLVIRKRWTNGGLYSTFERMFESLWENGRLQ